jgi:N-acetylmuramoyl-L-alanine amidase
MLALLAACSRAPAAARAPSPTSAPVAAPRPAPLPPAASRGPGGAARAAPPAPALPPIPRVDGPLDVHVVYPSPNQLLGVRDSNFILGSVGRGAAQLTIDGFDVPVYPDGAFLAWIPVPSGDKPRYDLRATNGDEVATATVPIALRPAPPVLPDTGRLVVDRASVTPFGATWLRSDEPVRVAVRAPANATVVLHTSDGAARPLQRGSGVTWSTEVAARDLARAGTLVVRRARDSVVLQTAAVRLVDAEAPRYAELLNADADATDDTDEVSILRPTAGGTYKWFLFPGTVVEVTGMRGDSYRVRLDGELDAWVDRKAARLLGDGTASPRRIASNARVLTFDAYTDIRIPVSEKPPYQVEPEGHALVLTLYGTASNVDIVNLATNDPAVRDVTWEQVASDRVRVTVHLRRAPFGWLVLWDRGALVLRVRHTPAVDAGRPLAGRVIAVDAGHPPAGATGPTSLYEGDAMLDVAQQLQAMLEAQGATVVMTRTTRGAVPLGDRAITARRANADAFVSLHLNAYPDGVNPLRARNGSGTYFFYDQAEPLARAVQRGLVRRMGLPDMGISHDNLAVARQSWMPAILCEGAFVIIPEQEAALRDPEFQRRYAAGVVDGLGEYFRSLAARP